MSVSQKKSNRPLRRSGFKQLMHGLARERLAIAIGCVAKAEGALDNTLDYIREREYLVKNSTAFKTLNLNLLRCAPT